MSTDELKQVLEKIANNVYAQFLSMGLRSTVKITEKYAVVGFRMMDLAKAIESRSNNKVNVMVKAKELGLWITITPRKENS